MKILLTMNLPYFPSHGGANKGNRYLLEGLFERGHSSRVVGPALGARDRLTHSELLNLLAQQGIRVTSDAHSDSFTINGVEAQAVTDRSRLRAILENQIREFQPDWVLVSSEDPSQNLLEAALIACPGRVAYLVHSPTFLPFGPQSFFPSPIRVKTIEQAALIVTCSRSVQKYVHQHGGLESEVFYWPAYGPGPFPDMGSFERGFVTLINPCVIKGLPIFLSIARRLPDIEFAAVPTWGTTEADREQLSQLANVRLLDPADDIEEILKQTRALLMPSLWPEGFPLICVETMLRGIPVVAGNIPGLVESKLNTDLVVPVRPIERFGEQLDGNLIPIPIVPEQDIDPWITAIRDLLSNRELYRAQSIAARTAALNFVNGLNVDGFVDLLNRAAHKTSRQADSRAGKIKGNAHTAAVRGVTDDLTPEQLAALIMLMRKERANRESVKPQDSRITTVSRDSALPLSFAQQRLWFVQELEPDSGAYNIPTAMQMAGALNTASLSQGLREITRRHEVLRTTFPSRNGEPVQRIAPPGELPLPIIDLSCVPKVEDFARRIAADEARRRFDLATGPLLRVSLLRLGECNHVLLATMHHVVSDGWSGGILAKEFAALYESYHKGEPSGLSELPIQYGDFAVWQRRWLQGDELRNRLSYWTRHLGDELPVLKLPTDKPRPARLSDRGAQCLCILPATLSDSLKALSLEQNCTLFMTLLAAFKTLLHYLTGQMAIPVGTDIANRNRPETEKLIGLFVNQLILRTELSGEPSFKELMARVREITLGAYAHQDLPFEKLVETLNPHRDGNRSPLLQVKMVLQNTPADEVRLPGLTLSPIISPPGTAKFDLLLNLNDAEQGLYASLQYNTDLFEYGTPARILRRFHTLLDRFVERPDARLNELIELLLEEDRREALEKEEQLESIRLGTLKGVKRKAFATREQRIAREENIGEENIGKDDLSPAREIKLDSIRHRPGRKPLIVTNAGLVTSELQEGCTRLPLVMRPSVEGVDLAAWALSNRKLIEDHLFRHGGILFRNFSVSSPTLFEQFATACSGGLLPYKERSSPRTAVHKHVYTSTDYPADQSIFLHNENSYQRSWPLKIFFFCAEPSTQGGETPIADCRQVLTRIDLKIRQRFMERGWMLVRNFGDGLSLSWQSVFQTDDKLAVEAYCRGASIETEWRGDRLRTKQVRRALATHPTTGEMVWFNHAAFFHVSTLEPSMREELLSGMAEEDLPNNTYYGDGSPIEPSVLEEIREAYRLETVSFAWQKGDILMLDNMMVAHGRNPYVGPRKVLVAMADLFVPGAAMSG